MCQQWVEHIKEQLLSFCQTSISNWVHCQGMLIIRCSTSCLLYLGRKCPQNHLFRVNKLRLASWSNAFPSAHVFLCYGASLAWDPQLLADDRQIQEVLVPLCLPYI